MLFAKVKAQLKKETPLLLKGFIPDGRNSRKSRKSRSKRKSRKSRRSGRCPDRILNPDHPFAKMPCRLHYFFITEDGIIGHEYKIGYKFDANYNYKPEDSYENTKKIIKWLIKNNYTSNANEIKNYHIPEKELEIQNQRFYEIQAFIEANKQKIEQVEKYDDIVKENMELREENEILKKSCEYLKENKNIKEMIVKFI